MKTGWGGRGHACAPPPVPPVVVNGFRAARQESLAEHASRVRQEIAAVPGQEDEQAARRAREQRVLEQAHREGRRLEPGELSKLVN